MHVVTSRLIAAALGTAIVLVGPTSHAQDQSETQAVVAQEPPPSNDGFVARLRRFADDAQIIERINGDIDGWYPRLGGITRGSGLALGPGYRFRLFDQRVFVDVSAALSTRGYRSAEAEVRWLQAFGERLELWTDLRYEDHPQEDFFGTGYASSRATRTSYDFEKLEITVRGVARPTSWLRTGASVGYMSPRIGPGSDDNYPSTEELFTDADAPGLAAQPDFVHTTFFGEIDYLDQRGRPRRGGLHRISFGVWDDRTLQQFDHRRFDALSAHYLPLTADKRHVVSGRLGLSYVNNETGERVPFYFLAYVGGVDTIRGYREFRFKDENALWLGAEYTWSVLDYLSVATFFDAGEVRADWNDIGLHGLRTASGFGVRFHTDRQTFARVDVGTGGNEGWQVFFKIGPR